MIQTSNFRPKFFTSIRHYNKSLFVSDLMAGAIVGIVALPLAIAFAIASGVSPEKGIIPAVIAGFIISFLGGSKVQIGGPEKYLWSLGIYPGDCPYRIQQGTSIRRRTVGEYSSYGPANQFTDECH